MGHTYSVKCKNCGYMETYYLGVGISDLDFKEMIATRFGYDKKVIKEIMDIIDNHKVEETIYENKVFKCNHCKAAHTGMYIKIIYDGDKEYILEYTCPKCDNAMLPIEPWKVRYLPCQKCGERKLVRMDIEILWD